MKNLIMFLLILFAGKIVAQEIKKDSTTMPKIDIKYTDKGFQFKTSDNKHLLHIESRLQFRFATPGDQDPLTFDDIYPTSNTVFKINRARLKIGGHAFTPDLKYYFEYELSQSNLLDFRLMFEKWKGFNIKVGQWKTYYSRERVISSGKQQMVDRSIINRPFTLDRQQGISFYGRLFEESPADLTYHLSLLTGTGRGSTENDDNKLLYVGRLQWNFLGREVSMSGSDLEHVTKPEALIAFAAATNTSPYTRFSQSGGGQLEGFQDGVSGQYTINQGLIETAFKYKGFSWQSELHHKRIFDNVNDAETDLRGMYVQAGYFFSNIFGFVPEPLEVAGRFGSYNPNVDFKKDLEEEFGLAFNWFFNGHRNKLTTEFTYFQIQASSHIEPSDGWRFRVQWDISL
ncbi:porin [Tamlana sp. 2_MG-2023]|uniref:porin n=1 Tax=unclassified Tamlana TaxID=2614803 RepID=UPI0026E3F0F2|nr:MULTISPECIES: porin [unclassified Tamlana]MDO6759520.1 porin [Tamlana sp. 2_MG-2023]MDO6790341.1 porin [Tamlana sp. 1_MG-2023]